MVGALVVAGLLVACTDAPPERAIPETTVGPHGGGNPPETVDPGSGTVRIDLAAEHQTMDGFGVSARVWSDHHLIGEAGATVPDEARSEILGLLFEDLGLTRLRSVLGPGMEPANDNDDPAVTDAAGFRFDGQLADEHIELVRAAEPFGLTTFFAAPVVLEPWMQADDTAEYVEWAMTLLRHWRSAGAEPPFFSPVNEPALRAERSAVWLRDVVRDLGRQLEAEGFATRLVIPDDLNPSESYNRAAVVLDDPEARRYVGALAFHIYGDATGSRLAELASTYDVPLWMTEFSPGGDSWRAALQWAGTMQQLITGSDVSAIDYMWGFFGSQERNTLIGVESADGRYSGFEVRPVYDAVGQFSRFIRPGAVRVSATSADAVRVSAFRGPDDQVVVVFVSTAHQPQVLNVEVSGGELGGSVSVTSSSAGVSGAAGPPIEATTEGFTITLPAESVTTAVVQRGG